MARKVISKTVVTDDFDGGEIQDGLALEVAICIAGTEFRLDLRPENVERFRADVAKWIAVAETPADDDDAAPTPAQTPAKVAPRRTERPRAKTSGRRKGPPLRRPREEIQAVREWAASQGFEVSERGRIPNEVHDAFKAAH